MRKANRIYTNKEIVKIRKSYPKLTMAQLAEEWNCSSYHIYCILKNKIYVDIKFVPSERAKRQRGCKHVGSKFTLEQILYIRKYLKHKTHTPITLAAQFNVWPHTIRNIGKNITYSDPEYQYHEETK